MVLREKSVTGRNPKGFLLFKISHVDHCQELLTHTFLFLFYILWFTYQHAGLSNTQGSSSIVSTHCLSPVSIKSTQNTEYIKRCFLEPLVYLSCRNEGARPVAIILLPLQTQIWTRMMSLSSLFLSHCQIASPPTEWSEKLYGWGLDCYQNVWSFQVHNFHFSFVSATHLRF